MSQGSGLGSLAQSARSNQLSSAKWILIVVGALSLAVNVGIAMLAESMVDEELKKETEKLRMQGMVIDSVKYAEVRKTAIQVTKVVAMGFAVVGGIMIVLGVLVPTYPVPMTVLGLVIYIGAWAVTAMIHPPSAINGLLIKIIIIAAMAKSIQSAIAYQRERDLAAQTGPLPG